MYPAPFEYRRAESVEDAVRLLGHYGPEARPLAGGQSLLVLMKMRFSQPTALVDLGFIPDLSYIDAGNGRVRIGALATHGELAASELAQRIPIVGDCANGIADTQVRSRGTIGGSLGSGDPSCDWPALLHTLDAEIVCQGPNGERRLPIDGFVTDLYETMLEPGEIIIGVEFETPPAGSGGSYTAFKRCAPAYPTASVGVQMTLADGNVCQDVRVALGSAGLTPIHATAAEDELRGKSLDDATIARAAEAAVEASDPVEDQRGSAEFKKAILKTLVRRAIDIASRRAGGETVEASHEYY